MTTFDLDSVVRYDGSSTFIDVALLLGAFVFAYNLIKEFGYNDYNRNGCR